MELFEACLADTHRLFGGRREGVPRRALGTENVSTMSAVVLYFHREGKLKVRHLNMSSTPVSINFHMTYLPDGERKAFPTSHAVLYFMILSPLPGQGLGLFDLKVSAGDGRIRVCADETFPVSSVRSLTWSDWFSLPSSCMAAVVSSSFLLSSTTLACSFSISPSPFTHLKHNHRAQIMMCVCTFVSSS